MADGGEPTTHVQVTRQTREIRLDHRGVPLTLAEVTSRPRRDLLNGAEAVLGRIANDPAAAPCAAVFYAAGLARAHVAADALDQAVPAAQLALRRLPTVRSRRCALELRRLEDDLAALSPTRYPSSVRSLQDQLRASHSN